MAGNMDWDLESSPKVSYLEAKVSSHNNAPAEALLPPNGSDSGSDTVATK